MVIDLKKYASIFEIPLSNIKGKHDASAKSITELSV
jgi:hypothetical protein